MAVNEPQKNTSKGAHAQGSPMKKSIPSSAKPNSTFSLTKSTKTKIMAKELMVPRENSSHTNTIMAVSQKKTLQCTVCGKLYETNAGLYKHRHPHMVNSTKSIQCKESNCDFTCKMLNQLRHHLEETHGMPMETRVMDFKNIKGNIHL